MGYAMNMEETIETGYKDAGNAVNVTELLQNGHSGASYSYAHGDIYQMNSGFHSFGSNSKLPYFENITSEYSSFPLYESKDTNKTYSNETISLLPVNAYRLYYMEFSTPVSIDVYKQDPAILDTSFTDVISIYCEKTAGVLTAKVTRINGSGYIYVESAQNVSGNVTKLIINGGPTDVYTSYQYVTASDNNSFVDLGAGYHFNETHLARTTYVPPNINLPENTKEFTITLDLDSITDPSYVLHLDYTSEGIERTTTPYTYGTMEIKKTTTGGVATWTLRNEYDSSAEITELYLDPEISNNTYQITIAADQYHDLDTDEYYFVAHITVNYVGSWPTIIGKANPYITYNLDYYIRDVPDLIFSSPISIDDLSYRFVQLWADNGAHTPIIRIDDSLYRAFVYKTITDRVFTPSVYRDNPSTTITDIQQYGPSFTFGGNTYKVKDGNITMGTHQVSIWNMVFDSVPVADGYQNRINGTVISTTAEPSQITFNGSWNASVSVTSMEPYTYTSMEWKAGHFGWNGIDTNFLLVGLITSLGTFIALGIYARRSRANVWPLMIVCGCAAAIFFIMI